MTTITGIGDFAIDAGKFGSEAFCLVDIANQVVGGDLYEPFDALYRGRVRGFITHFECFVNDDIGFLHYLTGLNWNSEIKPPEFCYSEPGFYTIQHVEIDGRSHYRRLRSERDFDPCGKPYECKIVRCKVYNIVRDKDNTLSVEPHVC